MTLLDTHALIWWLADPKRLSTGARRAIERAANGRSLAASAASVLEIATMVRRGRLVFNIGMEQWLAELERLPGLQLAPITPSIAARAGGFRSEDMCGDAADRLILATALHLEAALVSADERLRTLPWARTIW